LKAGKAILFALLCALAQPSLGGSFEVNPIRVELSPSARSAALTVKNSGTEAVVVQISVQAWSQSNGTDVLSPTREVLVSPPIATIAAGAEQIVRIGLRRAPDEHRELSYRLFLQEVPPPPKPGFQGLQVALRIGLPIFVQPRSGPAKPALVWEAHRRDPGAISLKLSNEGNGHIQISNIAMFRPGEKEPVATHASLTYVLPGQSRAWDLKTQHAGAQASDRLQLKASTDAGSIETAIQVAP
jgi:fimbrial chaperone protein